MDPLDTNTTQVNRKLKAKVLCYLRWCYQQWHVNRQKNVFFSHSELAANTDKCQLLCVDSWSAGSGGFWKQFLDEDIFAHCNHLLKTSMKCIIVLLQESSLWRKERKKMIKRDEYEITNYDIDLLFGSRQHQRNVEWWNLHCLGTYDEK